MKRTILLVLVSLAIVSCTDKRGDTLSYNEENLPARDYHSTQPGPLTQPGGVASEIEAQQGNASQDPFITIKE